MSSAGGASVPEPRDRRRSERRANLRVADLSLPEFRRILITSLLFVVVLALFVWMVRTVVIGAILGIVIGAYLRPPYRRLAPRLRSSAAAALLLLTVVTVPFLLMIAYAYAEIVDVARYVNVNQEEIVQQLDAGLAKLALPGTETSTEQIRRWVLAAADYGAAIPGELGEAFVGFAVSTAVLLFTAFYVVTDADRIAAYFRENVPPRYEELRTALTGNVRNVLYGAVYATLVTQALKTVVILALNLAFDVPLAVFLALLSFVIGFFPIVGSWSIYVPVALWLLIFREAVWAALIVLVVGFFVNTIFLSMYVRPKLAAEKSRVLNFYWMFLGLVTGVYTFGIAGLLIGPILIGMLKAIIDTITATTSWRMLEDEGEPLPSGSGVA